MTANQLVAYNLRRAREMRGETQEQVAQRLWPYIGEKWSKASFSIAEKSAEPGHRKRNFNANELLAFACVFQKPVAWFFTPPDGVDDVTCGEPLDVSRHVGRNQLLDVVLPHGLALRDHVKTLRQVALALELADPVGKEKDDG